MGDSSNLCIDCGICCKGIIIGFVQLEKNETKRLSEVMEIDHTPHESIFFHPCENLTCDGCSIYEQRPNKCIEFKCGLLKSVEQHETSFSEAKIAIDTVKEKKELIEQILLELQFNFKSKSFYFKMVELKKLDKNWTGQFDSDLKNKLIFELNELNKVLLRHFKISI